MERVFGEIAGVSRGAQFADRKALARAGVHRPLMSGISGSAREGADSIVVSGGYEDDEDRGDVITYTGRGGNDPGSKRQVADQELTGQNLALAVSSDTGLPVRVIRGSRGDPGYSPTEGLRYEGLFYVERYWESVGASGFKIWRYRLIAESTSSIDIDAITTPPPGSKERAYAGIQRIVRSTNVTLWVKKLHGFVCQICGEQLVTAAGPYAEGAHLRPVGRPHDGPDSIENVLCLCPNHHVLLDRGAITLDKDWNVVDLASMTVIGPLRTSEKHAINSECATYHRRMFGVDD